MPVTGQVLLPALVLRTFNQDLHGVDVLLNTTSSARYSGHTVIIHGAVLAGNGLQDGLYKTRCRQRGSHLHETSTLYGIAYWYSRLPGDRLVIDFTKRSGHVERIDGQRERRTHSWAGEGEEDDREC